MNHSKQELPVENSIFSQARFSNALHLALVGSALMFAGCSGEKSVQDTPVVPLKEVVTNPQHLKGQWVAVDGRLTMKSDQSTLHFGKYAGYAYLNIRYSLVDNASNTIDVIDTRRFRLPRNMPLDQVSTFSKSYIWAEGNYKIAGRLSQYSDSINLYLQVD